jgi:hypothetical protein
MIPPHTTEYLMALTVHHTAARLAILLVQEMGRGYGKPCKLHHLPDRLQQTLLNAVGEILKAQDAQGLDHVAQWTPDVISRFASGVPPMFDYAGRVAAVHCALSEIFQHQFPGGATLTWKDAE